MGEESFISNYPSGLVVGEPPPGLGWSSHGGTRRAVRGFLRRLVNYLLADRKPDDPGSGLHNGLFISEHAQRETILAT